MVEGNKEAINERMQLFVLGFISLPNHGFNNFNSYLANCIAEVLIVYSSVSVLTDVDDVA